MKQTIIIEGDNLQITEVSNNTLESAVGPGTIAEPIESEWFDTGVSRYPVMVEGLLVHRFKPLEDIKAKLMRGDGYDQRAALEMPNFLLMCHADVEYDDETKYQIHRNQQASFMLGAGIFKAHRYGNYFYNKVTGERVKRHKGINPYDDWERVRDEQMQPLNEIWVASGGNYSMVTMEPWYRSPTAGDDPIKFQKFLDAMTKRFSREVVNRAQTLRTLAGKENPISGRP